MKKLDIRHAIITLFLFLFIAATCQAQNSLDSIFIKSPVLCPPAEMYGNWSDEQVQIKLAAKHGFQITLRQIAVFRSCPPNKQPAVPPRFFAPEGWEYNQEKNRYIKK